MRAIPAPDRRDRDSPPPRTRSTAPASETGQPTRTPVAPSSASSERTGERADQHDPVPARVEKDALRRGMGSPLRRTATKPWTWADSTPRGSRDARRPVDRRAALASGRSGSSSPSFFLGSSSPRRCGRESSGSTGVRSPACVGVLSTTSRCSAWSRSCSGSSSRARSTRSSRRSAVADIERAPPAATHSHGIKHEILAGLQKRLRGCRRARARPPRRHGDEDGVRGARRDLLRVRGRRVLDLRARPDDRRSCSRSSRATTDA